MSKLLEIIDYVSIPEAAQFLSRTWDDVVTENDVLKIILAKHLKPSLLSGVIIVAKAAKLVSHDKLTSEEIKNLTDKYGDHNSDIIFSVEKMITLAPKGLYDFHSGYESFIESQLHNSLIKNKKFEESFFQVADNSWSFFLSKEDKHFFVTFTSPGHGIFDEDENYLNPHIQIVIRREEIDRILAKHHDTTASTPTAQNLETQLVEVVHQSFWATSPPDGHNRATKNQIIDWLMNGYSAKGLTPKAAERVYTLSKPDNIPKHGNLPQSKKPYPTPPYPK